MKFWTNPYKFFWIRIGGRPWTYILRDIYHKAEYVVLVGTLVTGFLVSKILTDIEFWIALGIFSVGFASGHFFWGKKYIEGQDGNST